MNGKNKLKNTSNVGIKEDTKGENDTFKKNESKPNKPKSTKPKSTRKHKK